MEVTHGVAKRTTDPPKKMDKSTVTSHEEVTPLYEAVTSDVPLLRANNNPLSTDTTSGLLLSQTILLVSISDITFNVS